MRIDAFLRESPMFAVNRAARRFESLTAQVLAADDLGFWKDWCWRPCFLRRRGRLNLLNSQDLWNHARECEPLRSSLEAKGLLQRKIDPEDARAFLLTLKRRESAARCG